jgi:hypothetical protein
VGRFWFSLCLRSLALATVAGLAVAVRILEQGEAPSPRTQGLVGLAMGAMLLVAPVAFGLVEAALGRWSRSVRFAAAALLTAPGFAGAFYFLFAVPLKFLRLDEEPEFSRPGSLQHEALGRLIDALGLFLVTGAKYLLPWPLALMALTAGLLAAAAPARATRLRDETGRAFSSRRPVHIFAAKRS